MTKINKEYTLQTFKASASNTSHFLENKGYKIPQTTLLHALSVFVGEKNWNTLQGLLKDKSEKQSQIQLDNKSYKDVVSETIDELLTDLDNKTVFEVGNDETILTLSFIKNRLEFISDEFFISWEKNKCLSSVVNADNKEYDDKKDTNSIEVAYYDTEKWKYEISQFISEKYTNFNNNILMNRNFFFNEHQEKVSDISLNKLLYSNTLVSISELHEVRIKILFSFYIFFISEIKKHFITDLDYSINININSKNFKNYTIQVFSSQPKNTNLGLIQFLRKYLENFQY